MHPTTCHAPHHAHAHAYAHAHTHPHPQPIFDEWPGDASAPSTLWSACEVVAYFALEHDVASTLGRALGASGLGGWDVAALRVEPVANEQWVEQIKVGPGCGGGGGPGDGSALRSWSLRR